MENRLIVRYRSEMVNLGGRWDERCAGRWRCSVEGTRPPRGGFGLIPREGGNPRTRQREDWSRKATRGVSRRPYRKPTQVGGGKTLEADERTLVKELGKLTP